MLRSTRFSPELYIRQKGWIRRWRRHRRRHDRWCRGHIDPRRQSTLAKFDRMKGSHWGRVLSGSECLINDFLVNVALRPRNSKKRGNWSTQEKQIYQQEQKHKKFTASQGFQNVSFVVTSPILWHVIMQTGAEPILCTSTEHTTGKRVMCIGILGNWRNTMDNRRRRLW